MPFRALELPQGVAGRVWLSAMPGRLESWESFLAESAQRQLTQVLCLTPLHEVRRLSPRYAAALAEVQLPFRWSHLPMLDFGLSEQFDDYRAAVDGLAATVREGGSVLIHCAAGIGRTGTTAACLLKRLGDITPVALQRVRDAGSSQIGRAHV